jgi:nicotinamidase-related amidase
MLTTDKALFLVIDIQGNLAHAMYGKDLLFQNLSKMIRGAQALEIPLIVTEQTPAKLGPTIPEISSLVREFNPVPKTSFSCCREESFMKALNRVGRPQVAIAGIESHVCIYQTTVDLVALGYEVNVICDCISSRTPENRTIGIERMVAEGGKRSSTEMALFELMKAAECNTFRELVKIVK